MDWVGRAFAAERMETCPDCRALATSYTALIWTAEDPPELTRSPTSGTPRDGGRVPITPCWRGEKRPRT